MRKSDRELGMGREITRREFVQDISLSALGLSLPAAVAARTADGDFGSPGVYYPPTRTGMRGSHPGSFEVAHALAREGRRFDNARDLEEEYDLVVVGGGISGLASAWFYRRRFGSDSRILIVENHDDFGGHAKRNEFHQGGVMRLAWGGVFNLEYPKFSNTVNALMAELDVDIDRLLEDFDFNYGAGGRLGPAIWFDAETYGRDVLVPGFSLRHGDHDSAIEKIGAMPLSDSSIESLQRFFSSRSDVLADLDAQERRDYLRQMSYIEFIKKHGRLTDEAAELFVKTTHGYWGVGADSLSAEECREAGLPLAHLLGDNKAADRTIRSQVAMFPDGNASIARLLVRGLIPGVAKGDNMEDVVTADFDYSELDRADSPVRIRLNSTSVKVAQDADRVNVSYVRDGQIWRVGTRHCVLACWNMMIPYLCPEMPERQKEALAYQVKRPLILTNVLIRSSEAADRLGITGAYCPGRLHGETWLVKGIDVGDYNHGRTDQGPVVMMFWGSVAPPMPGLTVKEQHRASRALLLEMEFEDFEREVRTVLDGMLGPAGFNVAEDVLAITVNHWPHGYAYDYLDLWDPEWPPGGAPHEIARKPFGNITIANADAGADAYTHVAIDQAWRAVNELD